MKHCLLVFLALLLLSCNIDGNRTDDPMEYVPEGAALVLKLENADLFFSNLRNNNLIKANNTHPLYQQLEEQLSFLKHLQSSNPAVLSFAKTGDQVNFSVITKGVPEIDSAENTQLRQIETLKYNDYDIKKYTLDDQVTFVGSIDSLLLISDSESFLKTSLDGNHLLPNDTDFARARKATSLKESNLYLNHENGTALLQHLLPGADLKAFEGFSNWTGLDVEITQSGIFLNGVSTAMKNNKLLNVFQGVPAAPIEIASIAPLNSKGFKAVGYKNYPQLQKNLQDYREATTNPQIESMDDDSTTSRSKSSLPQTADTVAIPEAQELQTRQVYDSKEEDLLANALEIGLIQLDESNLFAIRPEEILGAEHNFSAGSASETFRGISIYSYTPKQSFNSLLTPLFSLGEFEHYAIVEQFIVFSENRSALEDLIKFHQNQQVFAHSDSFAAFSNNLSSSSSLLYVYRNMPLREELSQNVSPDHQAATSALELEEYPLSATQFIYQNNYAHVHAVMQKTEATTRSAQGTRQTAAIHLDAPVATKPVFFSNHRSKGLDVAVQDLDNTLYLISEDGSIYWKKPLETRILGEIQEVDLYKNGRIQLAFATQNKLHVIDRNGNPVKPFPLEFKDEITQPLGLFDYSKTRDYRFVIVQGKEVLMFDRRGQRVKGFGFTEGEDELVHPLKHIRLGNRDYILAMEASGKLNILNRRGEVRVPVREQFDFSDNTWYEYENQFVSTSEAGEFLKINQQGKIQRETLGLANGHRIDVTPKTMVSLSENRLSIKEKEVSLDFGLYTAPQIFYINNKLYISLTDLQAQRVYLFDSNAELLPDFPVFGSSSIDLGNADADNNLELTVQGDKDAILIYKL